MKSFNTWFYGKSPTPLLKEPSDKRDYLRFIYSLSQRLIRLRWKLI